MVHSVERKPIISNSESYNWFREGATSTVVVQCVSPIHFGDNTTPGAEGKEGASLQALYLRSEILQPNNHELSSFLIGMY